MADPACTKEENNNYNNNKKKKKNLLNNAKWTPVFFVCVGATL